MKLLGIAAGVALSGLLAVSGVEATPDHCPPPKAHPIKAAYKPARHAHHRKHPVEPRYYEDESLPPPLPVPPPPPPRNLWRDGYGKLYDMGTRPWGPPPPCPCPPDHEGRLPDLCHFNVWYGFDRHYGLESGL